MKKGIVKTLLLITGFVFISFSMTSAGAGIEKNETVYVLLSPDGGVVDQRVVNRLHAKGHVTEAVDYGDYSSVRNMQSGPEPVVDGDRIEWNTDILTQRDIYYEGITDRQLPVGVSIQYFLDGMRVDDRQLTGGSGRLRLEIEFSNQTGRTVPVVYESCNGSMIIEDTKIYVPFLAQVSYAADLEVFSEIWAPDAIKVVSGKTMNLGFSAFPYPEAKVSFEMTGVNISLESLMITVVPVMPPIPETGIEEKVVELYEGVASLDKGFVSFVDAAGQLSEGSSELISKGELFLSSIEELAEGSRQIETGASRLVDGYNGGMGGLQEITAGLNSLSHGLGTSSQGMDAVAASAKSISESCSVLAQSSELIAEAASSLYEGLSQLEDSGSQTASEALSLTEQHPHDSKLYELGNSIIIQNETVKQLVETGRALSDGTRELDNGFSVLIESMDGQFIPGIEQTGAAMKETAANAQILADALNEYENGQKEFGSGLAQCAAGAGRLVEGIDVLDNSSRILFDGLNEFGSATLQMHDGLDKMQSQGIRTINDSLAAAADQMRKGRIIESRMKELAEGYRSFMDNERNISSSVQFLMKTDRIEYKEEPPDRQTVQKDRKGGFFERLLKLFGL